MTTVDPIKKVSEIEKLKSALSGRDLLLFVIGINSSLRISDLLKFTFEDLQGGKSHKTLKEGKTGKYKKLAINDSIREALAAIPEEERTGYLFPSRKAAADGSQKPISRIQAWRILNAAAERAGLTHINFGTHTMRKTFAYHAYDRGADITRLMRILNHSSQRETLRYIGIEQEELDDVFQNLNL